MCVYILVLLQTFDYTLFAVICILFFVGFISSIKDILVQILNLFLVNTSSTKFFAYLNSFKQLFTIKLNLGVVLCHRKKVEGGDYVTLMLVDRIGGYVRDCDIVD